MLNYFNYDNLNFDEELLKIENSDKAQIILDKNDKKCLFILGMLFANGVKIKVLNENELNLSNLSLDEKNKSFPIMTYVWSRLGDESFPSFDYSNVNNDMDKLIENVKRIGVGVNKIVDNPIENKIFLICPVRNATDEQRKWIEDFVRDKYNSGYTIHAPHLHTKQTDLFGGYAICTQNALGMASSEEIDIYYDQNSQGSAFDLGVAYALGKPIKILNKNQIVFRDNDIIDNVIRSWPYNLNKQMLIKNYKEDYGKRS